MSFTMKHWQKTIHKIHHQQSYVSSFNTENIFWYIKTRVYTLYVHPKVIKLLGFDTHVLVHIVNISITNFLLTCNQFWTCLTCMLSYDLQLLSLQHLILTIHAKEITPNLYNKGATYSVIVIVLITIPITMLLFHLKKSLMWQWLRS